MEYEETPIDRRDLAFRIQALAGHAADFPVSDSLADIIALHGAKLNMTMSLFVFNVICFLGNEYDIKYNLMIVTVIYNT
jgi:hypothetical protein